jgi:hypothetical protein
VAAADADLERTADPIQWERDVLNVSEGRTGSPPLFLTIQKVQRFSDRAR